MGRNKGQVIRNNLYMLSLIWHASHKKVILHLAIFLMQAILDFLNGIYFLRTIVYLIESGQSFKKFLFFISIILLLNTMRGLLNAWYYFNYNEILNLKVQNYINILIFQKAQSVELEYYEDPEFYNHYSRAVSGANNIAIEFMNNIAMLISFLALSVVILFYIGTVDPVIYIFGLCPFLAVYLLLKINKLIFDQNMETTKSQRMKDYVNRVFFLKEYAKEIKITNIFTVLINQYEEAVQNIRITICKYGKKLLLYQSLSSFTTSYLAFIGSNAYAVYRFIILRNLSIADFSMFFSSINTFNDRMNRVIKFLAKAQEHSLYIENLRVFFDYKIKMENEGMTPQPFESLDLCNVGFHYGSSSKQVINQINFSIQKGEKVAIVGHNGAGKSTLVKLLLRLYDVTDGKILYNGIDIRDYQSSKYREKFGTLFQDYQIFSLSIGENIRMDEISDQYENKIMNAVNKSNLQKTVQDACFGLDTILTREFDDNGIVLSGGEQQKIAIARAIYHAEDIVILDEPSSALDPIAEHSFFETIFQSMWDKTLIFITHRLSTAVLADTIYLMKDGEIIEKGTHRQLMKLNGEYSTMFLMQSELYKEGAGENNENKYS